MTVCDEIKQWRPGILPREMLQSLKNELLLDCTKIDFDAIDLHLSRDGWQMKGSLKLDRDISFDSISSDENYVKNTIDLSSDIVLHRGETYIIKVKEHLRSNHDFMLQGQATGKSSVGRLDVLTRLIVNHHSEYDALRADYNGPLYVEVTPITFPIVVKCGLALNQLRLFRGEPEFSRIGEQQIDLYGELLKGLMIDEKSRSRLTLDMRPVTICDKDVIALKAKNGDREDELEPVNLSQEKVTAPEEYWELVRRTDPREPFRIEKGRFYILRSRERFSLPSDVGVYCQAITENLGEIRIHYAGFVHPGFGYYREDGKGAPLIFEVRGHTIDAFLRHGEHMANICFYRLSRPVDFSDEDIKEMREEQYNNQELTLSKYFKQWDT